MEKYTDTEITHCTQCPRHCPIDSVQCGRGRKFAESLQRKGSGETGENKSHEDYEHKFSEHRAQEFHDRGFGENGFGGRGRQGTENFRSCGDSGFHGRPEGFRGPHGEGFREFHGEGFRGPHGEGFRETYGEDGSDDRGEFRGGRREGFREAREDFRRGWHRQGMELEPEDELSGLLRSCVYHLFQRGGRKNGQDRILHILSRCDELSQRELQGILRIQPGSISEILAKMEHAGLLIREKDQADKRKVMLKLTDEGRQRAGLVLDERNKDRFGALDEEQKEQLKTLLKLLLDSWD